MMGSYILKHDFWTMNAQWRLFERVYDRFFLFLESLGALLLALMCVCLINREKKKD